MKHGDYGQSIMGQRSGFGQAKRVEPMKKTDKQKETDSKIAHLESMEAERFLKRSIAVSQNESVKVLTSSIEENNNTILKLLNVNAMLAESRDNFVKEVEEEFDKENPSHNQEIKNLHSLHNNTYYPQWQTLVDGSIITTNTTGLIGNYKPIYTDSLVGDTITLADTQAQTALEIAQIQQKLK